MGEEPAAAEPRTAHRDRGDRLRAGLAGVPALLKGAAAAAGGVATIATLVFLFRPELQPRVAEPTPLPPVRRGQLDDLRIGRTVTLGDYCRSEGARRALRCDAAKDRSEAPGRVITFQIATEGLPRHSLPITWTMLDAATGEPLADPALTERPAWPDGVYAAELPGLDVMRGEAWVPVPSRDAPIDVVVEFVLRDDRGGVLDAEASPPFPAVAAPGATPATGLGRATGLGGEAAP